MKRKKVARRGQPKPYRFTPARRAALDAAREKRKFEMTPARWAAVRKAAAANRRNFRLTPARLKSMGINIRKAQAASVRKFRMTEARQQANLANLTKAWTTRHSPESIARSAGNRLMLGQQAREFERTFHRFGEDPAEFRALGKALERAFAPQYDDERALVKSVAEAIWLRCRLLRAQARHVTAQLKRRLRELRRLEEPDFATTEQNAAEVMLAMLDDDWVFEMDDRLVRRIERRLKKLVRKRRGDEAEFDLDADEPDPELEELDELDADARAWRRLLAGGPEVDNAVRKLRPTAAGGTRGD